MHTHKHIHKYSSPASLLFTHSHSALNTKKHGSILNVDPVTHSTHTQTLSNCNSGTQACYRGDQGGERGSFTPESFAALFVPTAHDTFVSFELILNIHIVEWKKH